MTRLDHLPPDQRAALALLLRQRKSYAEVASLLGISEEAIRERAHGALDGLTSGLVSDNGDELTATQRANIGDYLLGQQPAVHQRLATRTLLDSSRPAREWASALALELTPLAIGPLPEIPAGAPPPPDERQSEGSPGTPGRAEDVASRMPAGRSLPSSRMAGALLLTALITGVIVAVVLATGEGGGGGSHNTTPAAAGAPAATSAAGGAGSTNPSAGATSATTPSTTRTGPSEEARIALTSPNPASKTVGVAVILAEGTQHAFYLAAEHMPPTKGFFYAVWLYNSPTSFEALGKSPPVGADGRMQGGALLPTNAAAFSQMIVTRETSTRPSQPGPVVLSGSFKLGH